MTVLEPGFGPYVLHQFDGGIGVVVSKQPRGGMRCGAVWWAPMTSSVRLRKRKEEKNISRSRTDRQTDRQKANYSKGFAPVFQSGVGLLAFAFFPSLHDVKSQYEFRELFRQWQRGE